MSCTARAIAVFVPATVLTVQARAEPGDNSAAGLSGIGTYGRDIYPGRCLNCHSNNPCQSSLAPTLLGLIGRKAGGVHYSEKLKQLDFLWSRVSLRA